VEVNSKFCELINAGHVVAISNEIDQFGKMVRGLSEPRLSATPDPWKAQLT
jgi:hypothetical protein